VIFKLYLHVAHWARSSFAKTKVLANRFAKFASKQNAKTQLDLLSKFGS